MKDAHLRERGLLEGVEFPPASGQGVRKFLGRGWRLGAAEVRVRGPAPDMGEANEYVLGQMLGLSVEDIGRLRSEQVIGEELSGGSTPGVVSLERQAELGWIAGYESDYRQRDERGD